jgi:hypothetical protein
MTSWPLADLALPFDRITWRDGQLLTSRDLTDEKHADDRFRYLHVHYLHATWGIVTGFDVGVVDAQTVSVAPGFALDIGGREILLPAQATLTVPNLPSAFLLLGVRYRPDRVYRQQPDLRTVCFGASPALGNELPEFFWTTVADAEIGRDVLLAGAWAADGKLQSKLHPDMRRYARSEAQPRFFAGETTAGQTGWAVKPDAVSKDIMWLQADVNTSEAGFVHTPYYFAQLSSPDSSAFSAAPPVLFIQDVSPASFTAGVAYGTGLPMGTETSADQAESGEWTVSWFAVEAPYVDLLIFKGSGL